MIKIRCISAMLWGCLEIDLIFPLPTPQNITTIINWLFWSFENTLIIIRRITFLAGKLILLSYLLVNDWWLSSASTYLCPAVFRTGAFLSRATGAAHTVLSVRCRDRPRAQTTTCYYYIYIIILLLLKLGRFFVLLINS